MSVSPGARSCSDILPQNLARSGHAIKEQTADAAPGPWPRLSSPARCSPSPLPGSPVTWGLAALAGMPRSQAGQQAGSQGYVGCSQAGSSAWSFRGEHTSARGQTWFTFRGRPHPLLPHALSAQGQGSGGRWGSKRPQHLHSGRSSKAEVAGDTGTTARGPRQEAWEGQARPKPWWRAGSPLGHSLWCPSPRLGRRGRRAATVTRPGVKPSRSCAHPPRRAGR